MATLDHCPGISYNSCNTFSLEESTALAQLTTSLLIVCHCHRKAPMPVFTFTQLYLGPPINIANLGSQSSHRNVIMLSIWEAFLRSYILSWQGFPIWLNIDKAIAKVKSTTFWGTERRPGQKELFSPTLNSFHSISVSPSQNAFMGLLKIHPV